MTGSVMIAAGGTGGHLIPALAVASELMRRGHAVTVVTDRRGAGLARRVDGIPVHAIRAASPRGRSLTGKVAAGLDMLAGLGAALRLVHATKPSAVAGFGGYPTIPPLIAARLCGVPALIHEQNAVLGRANRFLAGKVDLVATSFEETRPAAARRTQICGVPVREAIAALMDRSYRPPAADGDFGLLVVGGSQGAGIFGETVPRAAQHLGDHLRRRLKVVQQCRPEDVDEVRVAWCALGVRATVSAFFEEMDDHLDRAHLVIARAGASTIAELAVSGRPSILVPLPHAADDHQRINAGVVAGSGGGWLVDQANLDSRTLASLLESLMASPETLTRASRDARRLARPGAASALADAIEGIAAGNGNACRVLKEQEA